MPAISPGTLALSPGSGAASAFGDPSGLLVGFLAPAAAGLAAITPGTITLSAGANGAATFIDPITASLTGAFCPALPVYPPTGDRYPGRRIYLQS
jgi:hypothetical protein